MTDPDGHAISFKVLRRGTTVRSADGVTLGTVRRVQENARENLFDGIVVETEKGRRFVDAPEVHRIYENAVVTTFTAAEADDHWHEPRSRLAQRMEHAPVVRRAKRAGKQMRNRWDQR